VSSNNCGGGVFPPRGGCKNITGGKSLFWWKIHQWKNVGYVEKISILYLWKNCRPIWTVLYKREPTALEISKIFKQLVLKIFEDGV